MIDDSAVEKALDWMVNNAKPAAQARANRLHLDDYSRVVKANLMNEKRDEALGAQERHAYSHPDYSTHLEALKIAIEEDERYRWLLAACEARIEAWRSMQANQRAQGKI